MPMEQDDTKIIVPASPLQRASTPPNSMRVDGNAKQNNIHHEEEETVYSDPGQTQSLVIFLPVMNISIMHFARFSSRTRIPMLHSQNPTIEHSRC
jgi:hypothetical protein